MMNKKVLCAFLLLLPVSIFAQATCDIVFTVVEQRPALKISSNDFKARLVQELKSENFDFPKGEIVCWFVVTNEANIEQFSVKSGNLPNPDILENSIKKFAGLWEPGKQNHQTVCCYVKLKLQFVKEKLKLEIL